MTDEKNGYVVAQLGARMHYAVPCILAEHGLLQHLFTDICAVKGWPRCLRLLPAALQPTGLRRLAGRVPAGIPNSKITAFSRFGWDYARRRREVGTLDQALELYVWAGKKFTELVLQNHRLQGAQGLYTFSCAGHELLRAGKELGIRTILEQPIAPHEFLLRILAEEQARFPGWEPEISAQTRVSREFFEREREEWDSADLILCGSAFVRDVIRESGGPDHKCRIVAYGVRDTFSCPPPEPRNEKLRVLTVGHVGLRKGAPYVLEAARRLEKVARFRMVGSVNVLPEAEQRLRRHVELTGPVARADVRDHFRWADVFLLPSLCEGAATVTFEALAAGRPVVCTPNTGSLVQDGVDGFVVPIRDVDAVVDRLEQLAADRGLLLRMSEAASRQSEKCSLAAYGGRMLAALGEDNSSQSRENT